MKNKFYLVIIGLLFSCFFNVNGAITVTSPNGGESYLFGTNQTITWNSLGVAKVKIEYSLNNGSDWSKIVDSTDAVPGSYNWLISDTTSSNNCLIKITNTLDVNDSDVSDAVFTIHHGTIQITSPNGGENWLVGSTKTITWNSTDIANVHIEYSTDNGSNWITIIGNTPANTGSYNWTVPNTVSNNCLIRMSDVTYTPTSDVSNAVFRIYKPTITITSPVGSEYWRVGTTKNITWNSNDVANVKIDYSTNDGVDWFNVVPTIAANVGNYLWTIPNTVSTNCKVRISDVLESTTIDESDSVFTIYSPDLSLTAPNGGELWRVGSTQNITWNSNDINNVKLEYSINNGSDWQTIVNSTDASTGNFAWVIPNSNSIMCMVRISNVDEPSMKDVSTNTFTIYTPTITLTAPNGGENLRAGTTTNITWNSSYIASIKLEYSINNGTDWIEIIDSSAANTGSYSWTVPNNVSNQCKVRISDVVEPTLNDESNGVFTIYNPIVLLTSPNGGEYWRVGTQKNITWTSNNVANIKLEYTTNNGADWFVISNNQAANLGLYVWDVPNKASTNCLIRISNVLEPTLNDVSDAVFTIYQPAITLTSPNGSERWRVGTTQNITWNSNDIADIKIEYTTNNGTDWNVVQASVAANLGTYGWTIPNTISTECKVRISDVLETTMLDVSNAAFTIYNPTIVLTSPNGGELWEVGTNQNITWTSTNIANIKIEYTTNYGADWFMIAGSVDASLATYNWTIPNSVTTTCKVKISDVLEPTMLDTSNNNFTIFKPGITVTSPNGSETWRIGTQKTITWTSNNVSNVKIEYSTNNGVDWISISPSVVASLRSYDWTVPNNPSADCLVKISDVSNINTNDVSNNKFTIYQPSLVVSSPNGGESWRVGTSQNITWQNNFVSNAKLEYTTNNGIDWITIAASTPASALTYAWTIPNVVSALCKVRISDAFEPAINDTSNNVFEIYKPVLTLTSPIGGENWRVGTNHDITWTSTKVNNIKIEYTTDNGNTWLTVNNSIPAATNIYTWTIPNTASTNCKVKISDVLEPEVNSASNNNFTIYTPTIVLSKPNGGENWRVNTQQNITWTSSFTNNLNIDYSTDNGNTWNSIVTGVNPALGTYAWVVPNTVSTECKVKISDALEPTVYDESENVFSIFQPVITLTSPDGGELWRVGTDHNITWTSSNFGAVKIEYTTNNGLEWIVIIDSVDAVTGTYLWSIPNTTSTNCKVRVSKNNEAAINDISNSSFTIYAPTITLTSPNGSELWRVGANQNITWNSNNISNVKIEYSTNAGTDWAVIVESTNASTQTYNWLIPNTPSTDCKVRISDVLEPEMNDTSNNKFTIYQPLITVTEPTGGESWRVGTSQTIRWTSNNVTNIKIEYSTNNGIDWSIITAVTSAYSGSYGWIVPNTVSTECRIKISDISELSLYGISDSTFEIYKPAITVTNPNGGELLKAGSVQPINWISNHIANVKLEYSTDNGINWLTIAASTPAATGIYNWLVPSTPSSVCRVRVSDVNETTMNDVSDAPFTIFQPGISLISPNGNELWRVGTQHAITWTSINIANIKIQYTTNNGTSWNEIVASTPDSLNSFSWVIPNTTSNNCKVKISDVVDSTIYDESDATFIIYQPAVTVTKPNGGEKWRVGTKQNITWLSNNITNVKIEYTANGDTTWNLINASVTASLGTYSWTVPNTISTKCKIRVSAVNELTLNDESNNYFTIYEPKIVINNPSIGNKWRVATSNDITWTSNDIENLKIEYSINNGATWISVVNSTLAATGKYTWVVPNTPSENCKVRLSDVTDASVNVISDSTFSIYQPAITVTAPNGNESWRIGTEQNITWSSNNISKIKIEYTTDSGNIWTTVASNVTASTGKYTWVIPNTESSLCKIRISDVDEPELNDVSNGSFRIYQSVITVVLPNGGENWRAGELESISWTSNNVSEVKIEYTTNDTTNWSTIISGVPAGSGKYTWSVPHAASTLARIRISDVTDSRVKDISNSVFTIFESALTLTSPNGGESWRAGSTRNITWSSSNIGNVNLEYTINNGSTWLDIAQNIDASLGTYQWTLPSDISSNSCKVRVSNSNSATVSDISNSVFTINKATILLSAPNGGENWRVGTNHYIAWQSNNISAVNIEYSTDAGNTWLVIASNISSSANSYVWNVSNVESENCRVRVSDIEDINVNSISINNFTISKTGIKLLYPNGGEYWRAGTTHYITWQSSDVASVKLEYSIDNGIGWNTIANNVSANSKSYTWVIPGDNLSKLCKIRVSDMAGLSFNDASDSVFTIYQPTITLIKPNGGEEYQIGIENEIQWVSNDIENVKIEITTNNGATWNNVVGSTAAVNTIYKWTTKGNSSDQCKLRISDAIENSINDYSDSRFTIFKYPTGITVSSNVTFGDVLEKSNYKLIGLPGEVNIPISQTIYGEYSKDWRAFYDNGSSSNYYVEYDGSELFNFTPGKAFWITSREALSLVMDVKSVDVDNNNCYSIPLHSGWNIISNPFETQVSWSKIVQLNSITLNPLIYSWDNKWINSNHAMYPYIGYYFYNAHELTEMKIPYNPTGNVNFTLAKTFVTNLEITLSSEEDEIAKVYVGVNDSAKTEFDENDFYAAPSFFEETNLRLFNNNICSPYKYLFTDVRPMQNDGIMFELTENNVSGNDLKLTVGNVGKEYENYELYLVDRRLNKFYNLKEINEIFVPKYYKENNYNLLIGSSDFVNGIKQSLNPTDYCLYQNYPNPFNAGTVIRYSIPSESVVNISIYNTIGELVRTYGEVRQGAGYYETLVEINNLASGVYFYRIIAKPTSGGHSFNEVKKMILLK